jgi:hypothetical protein
MTVLHVDMDMHENANRLSHTGLQLQLSSNVFYIRVKQLYPHYG